MLVFAEVENLAGVLKSARDHRAIVAALSEACAIMRFRYFALTHHVDFLCAPARGVRIHNYPDGWSNWFDANRLGISDPIHRASHRSVAGFRWADVPAIIALTPMDRDVLARARLSGIGDGVTIPANVPGEALGSCSFATVAGEEIEDCIMPAAQWIGLFAFEAARRIDRKALPLEDASVTDRQRECILWLARGKTDLQIAQILGVRHLTVVEHVKNARVRYQASSRAVLAVRALFEGVLSFSDILKR